MANKESNPFVKRCEQCKEYKPLKDVKYFPALKELYDDGHINEAPARYYCNQCMLDWGMAYDGMSYEEWSAGQPLEVWEDGVKIK